MPLPILGTVENFLPLLRKQVLPIAMPWGLWLPAVIEVARWMVPVMHPDLAASRFDRNVAYRAFADKAALGFSLFAVAHRVLHSRLSSLPQARHCSAGIVGCIAPTFRT
jgi:hypothetical protein